MYKNIDFLHNIGIYAGQTMKLKGKPELKICELLNGMEGLLSKGKTSNQARKAQECTR